MPLIIRNVGTVAGLYVLALVLVMGASLINIGAVRLVVYALFHALVIILPIGYFAMLARERGVRNHVLALSVGACLSGIFVYTAFWMWMISPAAGILFSVVGIVSMGVACANILRRTIQSTVIREWGGAVALWFFYALFVLSAGLAPFGTDDVLTNVAVRFSHPLPIDNQLPFIFAKQIAKGSVAIPMIGDWLSSDRPPLQTAYFLASGAVKLPDSNLHYQVSGTLLQCLWVIALWAILRVRQIGRYAMSLVLAVPMFSGFAIVHALFTWPKLLPVFFILLAFGLLFDKHIQSDKSWKTAAVTGCLAALAMLCHGGSVFALLGIALALLMLKGMPRPAFIAVMIITGLALLLTWSFYQAYVDPPGNRLLKWHLAGVVPIDDRSFGQTLIDSYSALSPRTVFDLKWANALTLLGRPMEYGVSLLQASFGGNDIAERLSLRDAQFFTLAAAWGWFAIAPFVLLGRSDKLMDSERILGLQFLVASLCVAFVWVLLLYGPGHTVIHQGSLALLMFLFSGSVLVASGFSRVLAGILAALHLLSVFFIYFSYGWAVDAATPDYSLYGMAALSFIVTVIAVIASSKRITTASLM